MSALSRAAAVEVDPRAVADVEIDGDVSASGRPMRADARRNYERLVSSAKEVFAEQGGDASLEAVAKHAGVGVGTLYRHFPSRIDLVEAVYRNDVDQLMRAADASVEELEPWTGLVRWLEAFVRYAQGKRVFLNELHQAFEKNPRLKCDSKDRIDAAMEMVLRRAQDAGDARTDVDGADVMELVRPMCMSSTIGEEQVQRLLTMVLDGLRPPAR
jgi:AcrR family transcriptional regulator